MATIQVPRDPIFKQTCDISGRPVKKTDDVFKYQIGDTVYDEVAGETIAKIEKYVKSLRERRTRASKKV